MKRYLALDIATTFGWAAGFPGSNEIVSGRVQLPTMNDTQGPTLSTYRLWLEGALDEHRSTEICYEETMIDTKRTAMGTAVRLMGLAALTEMVAFERGIQCYSCKVQEWRRSFIGFGNWNDRRFKSYVDALSADLGGDQTMRKADVRKRALKLCALIQAQNMGWDCEDDNEAEALGILHYIFTIDDAAYGARHATLAVDLDEVFDRLARHYDAAPRARRPKQETLL